KDAAHDALSLQCCVEILAIAELKNLPKRDKEALQKHWWTLLQSLEWTDRNGRLVVLLEEVGGAFKAADATKFKARMEQVIQTPPHLTDHDTQWILDQVAERKEALSTFKKKLTRAAQRREHVVAASSDSDASEDEEKAPVVPTRERTSRQSKAVASAKMNVVDLGDSEEVEVISSTSGNESEF
ncbi:hypothetical protein DYB28_001865, partial [Aphanomyces astaci]